MPKGDPDQTDTCSQSALFQFDLLSRRSCSRCSGNGEGAPIGVCRKSNDDEAVNSLLIETADTIGASELAAAIIERFGAGSHQLSAVHREMKGELSWPDTKSLKEKSLEIVVSMFKEEVSGEGGTVQIKEGKRKTTGKWQVIVHDKTPTS